LVWFEPERVMPGSWLRQNHPEWLLSPSNLPAPLAYQQEWRLLNLGDSAARGWAERTFSGLITEFGVDVYRQDFNMHPLYYWRTSEAADRQGMNEICYVEGLYDYLDTLRKEHPNLLIDNCASGGRRLDFEMMRRSVPLWRSDYCWDPIGAQSIMFGLSYWLPLQGLGAVSVDPYDVRSGMGACASFAFDYYLPHADFWTPLAARIQEYRRVQALFQGNYYPLTPYSVAKDVWVAWQFDRPDLGEGLVQAFRRPQSAVQTAQYHLHGLIPDQLYAVTDVDSGATRTMSGRQLMTRGLPIALKSQPGAALITYRRVNMRRETQQARSLQSTRREWRR
jgi:alpha-galactosidase